MVRPSVITAAVVQLRSTEDVEANLDAATRFIAEAAAAGAELVATPENTAFLRIQPDTPAPSQALDGPIIARLREAARDSGVWLLVGSFQESVPGEQRRYANTSVLIDGTKADAPIQGAYRKLHLFDIDIADGETQKESDWIVAGDRRLCVEAAGRRLGMSICYDLRFPQLYQSLVDDGAEMLSIPSAFTEFTGKEHWLPLLRARAIENQCYVLAPNQYGLHGGRRRSYGKSAIFDPWGTPLAVAPDRPGWVLARLDFDYLAQVRANMPCLRHRHPAA